MSFKIREWLKLIGVLDKTSHADRLEIDREVERRTGVDCDKAIAENRISLKAFRDIVDAILKKKRKQEAMMVV